MRLFIALELPPQLRRSIINLINWLQSQPGFGRTEKWVEEENLHLTVAFLGEVPPLLLPKITIQLQQVADELPSFSLKLEPPVSLQADKPRLIIIPTQTAKAFQLLQQNLGLNLKKINISVSQKPAHLTLVRLKSAVKLPQQIPWQTANLPVSEFSLMQSTLTPKGPIYKPLKAFKLTPQTPRTKFRPSVAVCLINPKNEVLLIWRSENRANDLGFPQGGINRGETSEATARRELEEELGLKQISVLTVKERVYTYRWPKGLIKYGKDINKRGYVGQEQSLVIARTNEVRPKLRPHPVEAAIVRWIPLDKLLETLKPKRRALGRLVMVELDNLGITNYE